MSARITIPANARAILVTGRRKVTKDQHKQIVKDVIQDAGKEGARTAVKRYSQHVAKEHGDLIRRLISMIMDQFVFPDGADKIEVVFDMTEMKKIPYSKYHIDGKPHHPGDTSPYTNPTKGGTRPIQSVELMQEIKKQVRQEVTLELKAAGIEVR